MRSAVLEKHVAQSFLLRVEHALEYGKEPKERDVKMLCLEHRALVNKLDETLKRFEDWRELERFVRIKAAAPHMDLDSEIVAVLRRLRPS